jgi:hypothetical protein
MGEEAPLVHSVVNVEGASSSLSSLNFLIEAAE